MAHASPASFPRQSLTSKGWLLLSAFALILLWPLCLGRTLYWGDILLYFAPMLRLEQSALQQGHILLWNPNVLGGQPFIGNPQMGVFYPATVLLPWLPVWLYLSLTTIVHVILSGAFMALYLRRWTRSPAAALAGGLVYMGSECLIGRIQFPPMIFTAPYFPLLLLCIDRYLDNRSYCECQQRTCLQCLRKRLKARLSLVVVIGLMILAAHPQMAYLILAFGCVYAIARIAVLETAPRTISSSPASWRLLLKNLQRHAPGILTPGGLALLLTSVQTLPAIQLLLESPREKLSPAQANRFFLEPAHLLTLLFPRFWGHPAASDFWGGGNAWEPAFFIGWAPLALIGIACARLLSTRRVRLWMAIGLIGIWLALGNTAGLYWLAFKVVPGLSNFHDPARFLIYTTFAFATLTAFGWEACSDRLALLTMQGADSTRRLLHPATLSPSFRRNAGLLTIALPLWWYGRDWNPTVPHEFLQQSLSHVTIKAENQGWEGKDQNPSPLPSRIYLPAHELFWKHYITDGYSDYGPDDTRSLQAMLDTLMPNIGMAEGLESASGYEPVPVSAPSAVDGLGRTALKRSEPNFARLMTLMGARALLLPRTYHLSDPSFDSLPLLAPSSPGNSSLNNTSDPINGRHIPRQLPIIGWLNRDALPRAWLVRHTHHVEGKTRIIAALAAPDFQPDRGVILCDARRNQEPDLEWQTEYDTRKAKGTTEAGNITNSDEIEIVENNVPNASITKNLALSALRLKVDCGMQPAFLILSSTAFPGWKATVDGKPAVIHRADGSLMGLFLMPGQHRVVLNYSPSSYRIGYYLTLLASSVLSAGYGLLLAIRNRRNRHQSSFHTA